MTEQALGPMWLAESLESALAGDDPVVRRHAAEALGHMRDGAVGAIPALACVSLADRDSGVRAAAVNALTEIGAPEDVLLENAIGLLGHQDQTVRARAGWAIGKLDPTVAARAISVLSELLATDTTIDARFGAAWAFGRMRSTSHEALEALERALRDPVADVRAEAARALGRTGPAASSTTHSLVMLLADSDPLVREQAAVALVRVDAADPDAIHGLRTLLTDSVDYVRRAATKALDVLGASSTAGSDPIGGERQTGLTEDERLAPALLVSELEERLLEPDDFARAEAPWLLAKIGGQASESTTERLVIQALVDHDADARWSALHSLARIAKCSPEVTKATLRILAYDRDPDVREAAAAALGDLWEDAPEEAVAGLVAALSDKDALVREDAAEALGVIGTAAAAARDALRHARQDPHGGVRARAAESLSIIAPAGRASNLRAPSQILLMAVGLVGLGSLVLLGGETSKILSTAGNRINTRVIDPKDTTSADADG